MISILHMESPDEIRRILRPKKQCCYGWDDKTPER